MPLKTQMLLVIGFFMFTMCTGQTLEEYFEKEDYLKVIEYADSEEQSTMILKITNRHFYV